MSTEMYERYVDDSNQIVIVPPPGAMYDPDRKKIVIDDNEECDDERTARVMTDIANSVMTAITMEFNIPSRNTNEKMPILDIEVWIEKEEGNIMFQHYEKPTASQSIMQSLLSRYHDKTVCIHRRY